VRSPRRALSLLFTVIVLAGSGLAQAGCGSTGHVVGAVVAHHAINQIARTPTARRRVDKVFCLYHGHRILVDLRTHHVFAAGLNAIAAYNACKAGFSHRR